MPTEAYSLLIETFSYLFFVYVLVTRHYSFLPIENANGPNHKWELQRLKSS